MLTLGKHKATHELQVLISNSDTFFPPFKCKQQFSLRHWWLREEVNAVMHIFFVFNMNAPFHRVAGRPPD